MKGRESDSEKERPIEGGDRENKREREKGERD